MDDRKPRSLDDLRRDVERAIDPRPRKSLTIFDELHQKIADDLRHGMVTNRSGPFTKPKPEG